MISTLFKVSVLSDFPVIIQNRHKQCHILEIIFRHEQIHNVMLYVCVHRKIRASGFCFALACQERVTECCLFLMYNSWKKVQPLPHTQSCRVRSTAIPIPQDLSPLRKKPLQSGNPVVSKGSSFGSLVLGGLRRRLS